MQARGYSLLLLPFALLTLSAGKIVIKNLSHATFIVLLEYIYAGQLVCSADNLLNVLMAADLYGLALTRLLPSLHFVYHLCLYNLSFCPLALHPHGCWILLLTFDCPMADTPWSI
jgi:hypothetical protein